MSLDTVSFSLKNTYQDNTLYNTWVNRVKNGNKKEFKEFLLSSDENLQLFARHFDGYQEGDLFVKESVVELADGRLLCFDADQAQAYIIDLDDIDENRDRISMKIITPNDPNATYDKQIENIIKQIKVNLGNDKFKTQDGTQLDEEYILTNLLKSTSLSLYQEAKGITTNSETGEAGTNVDPTKLNKIYYTNLNQITNEDEEKDYWEKLLGTLGVSVDSDKNLVDGTTVIQNINETIDKISKELSATSLTLSNQNRLNLLELVRKLSLSEITLIEKLNPGLMQAIGDFIGTYQGVTSLNKYGQATTMSETISWADLMAEKSEMEDNPLAYLSFEDRKKATVEFDTKNRDSETYYVVINGKQYIIGKATKYPLHDNKVTIDGVEYEYNDGKLTANAIKYCERFGDLPSDIKLDGEGGNKKLDSAKALANNEVDEAKTAIEVSSYINNNKAQVTSQCDIDEKIKDFNQWFQQDGGEIKCSKPDKALEVLAKLRDPELAFRFLQDPDVQANMRALAETKGSLAGGQDQEPEMYAVDASGTVGLTKQPLTCENIANHLGILIDAYKQSKLDANGNYIAGDTERLEDQDAIDTINDLLDGMKIGKNVKENDNTGTAWAWGGSIAGVGAVGIGTTWLTTGITTLSGICLAVGTGALGAAAGYTVGEMAVNLDPSKYTNANGEYRDGKANTVKTLSTISGTLIGLGIGLALDAKWGLATGGLSIAGGVITAAVGAVVGGVATLFHFFA